METARIEIVRSLTDEGGDVVEVTAADPDGNALPLIESLGLLNFAQMVIVEESREEDE